MDFEELIRCSLDEAAKRTKMSDEKSSELLLRILNAGKMNGKGGE